ncbi:50S ribosomal protein L9 [Sulfuricaulis limicola]|uniref:Large ribosomal subunit protein bL9 n=1 Tax=Sulfuricaulis limicola TaxID=1620215 RepID=A0A1B4XFQ6_9GAMM|nr:50S ribosomal protein L9 [Sulfuricaulis limicola]BAV33626.1 50S ribosomal protein L9 [Sulfuricaulis limicola]
MEVILLEKVRNLGNLGEQVKVKSGFARNYLIPYGKAVTANEANRAKFEAQRAELEKAQADALGKAQARAEKMTGFTVQIVRKVSEEGKLFGSVGIRDICDAMEQAGFELARSEVHLDRGPLKEIGDHEISVSLHPEVNFKLIVSVIGEK